MFNGRPASLELSVLKKPLLALIGTLDYDSLCCGLRAMEVTSIAGICHGGICEGARMGNCRRSMSRAFYQEPHV